MWCRGLIQIISKVFPMEIFKLDEVITSLKEYYKREMQKSKETNDEQ